MTRSISMFSINCSLAIKLFIFWETKDKFWHIHQHGNWLLYFLRAIRSIIIHFLKMYTPLLQTENNCFSKFDYGNTKCVLCTKVLSSPSKLSLVNEESSIDMYILPCEKLTAGEKLLNNTGSPASHLWWPRGVGWQEGREAQEGSDIRMIMAGVHCTTEGVTPLESNFPPVKT